jgi:hypothetical protein
MPEPKGESQLRALASRFGEAEARIRLLLAEALTGNRRHLLREALELLIALRREDAEDAVAAAYIVALGRAGKPNAVEDLALSLAKRLDQGTKTAYQRAPAAFRHVTPDSLTDWSLEAVTADVDKQGKRWPLGAWGDMQCHTIGRRASSRGTLHRVGSDGKVTVSSHGTQSEVCKPLEGKMFDVFKAPTPPFHPHCQHYLIPA